MIMMLVLDLRAVDQLYLQRTGYIIIWMLFINIIIFSFLFLITQI